jgi:hypothetical protein
MSFVSLRSFWGGGRQEELVLGSALSTSHPIISADP